MMDDSLNIDVLEEASSNAAGDFLLHAMCADVDYSYVKNIDWLAHVPLAFALTLALKPQVLVELGTTDGTSYFSFCQAAKQGDGRGRFFSVFDINAGSESARQLRQVNEAEFHNFSRILPTSRQQALARFQTTKIDLLHWIYDDLEDIDAAVEPWLACMSTRSVLLISSVGKSIQQLNTLRHKFPNTYFDNSNGLLVVFTGEVFAQLWPDIFNLLTESSTKAKVVLTKLGKAMLQNYEQRKVAEQSTMQLDALRASKIRVEQELASVNYKCSQLLNDKLELQGKLEVRHREIAALTRLLLAAEERVELADTGLRQEFSANSKKSKGRGFTAKLLSRITKSDLESQVELVQASEFFDAEWYLRKYPDVAGAGVNPAEHFTRFGAFEHRDPGPRFNVQWYFSQYPEVMVSKQNPLVHYLRIGRVKGFKASPKD